MERSDCCVTGKAERPEGVSAEHEGAWLCSGGGGANNEEQMCKQLQVPARDSLSAGVGSHLDGPD